jgi:hypothetical protein
MERSIKIESKLQNKKALPADETKLIVIQDRDSAHKCHGRFVTGIKIILALLNHPRISTERTMGFVNVPAASGSAIVIPNKQADRRNAK